jgi:hypothetical protein
VGWRSAAVESSSNRFENEEGSRWGADLVWEMRIRGGSATVHLHWSVGG